VPRDKDRRASLHADWPRHDVEIANLIDKLDHHRPLTGYHERIVKRVDHDRLIVFHEFAQPCISIAPIFNHAHLSPIEPRTARCFMAENGLGITTCAVTP
jgi:hypothetical protein